MGKLSELQLKQWGFDSRAEFPPKTVAVTTTQGELLKNNPDRITFLVINLGTEVAHIHTTTKVGAALGIYLDKNGGWFECSWNVYGALVGYPWFHKGAGATNLYLMAVEGV